MVSAFLYGRTMRVHVGSAMSDPRTVPGGSPQGSILGNFLFCVATRELGELNQREAEHGIESQSDLRVDDSTVSFDRNGLSGNDVSGDQNADLMISMSLKKSNNRLPSLSFLKIKQPSCHTPQNQRQILKVSKSEQKK